MGVRDSAYPSIVKVYKRSYEKMASKDYVRQLAEYAESVLHDSFRGLDWKQLLDWEHRHLQYTKGELPRRRARLPVGIIAQAEGRCGEFALLYNGLLLANGYRCRLVVDCSKLRDKSRKVSGDHVWVEVFVDDKWVHVDPTESRVDQPLMYALDWEKDVNLVHAITDKEVVDVTDRYKS